MTSGQVQQLIDAIKSASPAIWAAAQHQVQAEIVQDWMWIIIFSICAVLAFLLTSLIARQVKEDDLDTDSVDGLSVLAVVCGLVCILFLALISINANDLIQKTQAPDYAAIQNLTNLLPSP